MFFFLVDLVRSKWPKIVNEVIHAIIVLECERPVYSLLVMLCGQCEISVKSMFERPLVVSVTKLQVVMVMTLNVQSSL